MSKPWTDQEKAALHKLWRSGKASRKTLQDALPNRVWRAILEMAKKEGLPLRHGQARPWSDAEIEALKTNWDAIGLGGDWKATLPGRRKGSINHMANRIGLRRRERDFWSDEENAIIRAFWKKPVPIKVWAEQLPGRTHKAIVDHARKIKLGKRDGIGNSSFSYVEMAVKNVLEATEMLTTVQIAERTGHSRQQVRHILNARDFHIAGWIRNRPHGAIEARWALGEGENEPLPKATSHAASMKEFRESKKIAGKGNHFAVLINQLAA